VDTVLNFQFLERAWNFLTSKVTVNFSRRTLFHRIAQNELQCNTRRSLDEAFACTRGGGVLGVPLPLFNPGT
jgi:hypothetical protein